MPPSSPFYPRGCRYCASHPRSSSPCTFTAWSNLAISDSTRYRTWGFGLTSSKLPTQTWSRPIILADAEIFSAKGWGRAEMFAAGFETVGNDGGTRGAQEALQGAWFICFNGGPSIQEAAAVENATCSRWLVHRVDLEEQIQLQQEDVRECREMGNRSRQDPHKPCTW
ncbi:unnamed protein product [Durusdinium trenchii]|uniref:Uncharacterized protein n=1 Tax=Durusdinium trenchii TaxID=1381693 RepID=A0ABP0P6J2_9DINO